MFIACAFESNSQLLQERNIFNIALLKELNKIEES
jgi:hypothetical protein